MPAFSPLIDRFFAKIAATHWETCWRWQAGRDRHGYGKIAIHHNPKLAHRVAYLLAFGHFPPAGTELDHLCRTRDCVNPTHLEPVTKAENMRRGAHATKTHCKPRVEALVQLGMADRGTPTYVSQRTKVRLTPAGEEWLTKYGSSE